MSNLNTKNNKEKEFILIKNGGKEGPQTSTDFAKIANENLSLLRMKHPNKYRKNYISKKEAL